MPRSRYFPLVIAPFSGLLAGLIMLVGGTGGLRAQSTADDTFSPPNSRVVSPMAPMMSMGETIQPELIFFPPNPPPMGVPLRLPTGAPGRGVQAPEDLRPFVTELFYPPLSSYMFKSAPGARGPRGGAGGMRNSGLGKHQALLDGYRSLRDPLLAELRAKIENVVRLDPETRRQELQAFARVQADRLAHLEDIAEKLRLALARETSWYEHRQWKLGRGNLNKPREENRVLESQLLRAAAFYQEGLIPAQRRLLREMAMQMEETIYTRGDPVPLDRIFLYFQPETARFRLPQNLAPELANLIDELRERKTELKDELSKAIYELDGVMFSSTRRRSLAEIADDQTGRLAEIERLAEEIRLEVVHAPGAFRVKPAPPMSVELAQRIADYQRDAAQLARQRSARGSAAGREIPRAGREATSEQRQAAQARQREAVEMAEEKFDREMVDERLALDARLQALIQELTDTMGLRTVRSSESFLNDYMTARQQIDAYHEYSYAVVEPGLSPEQRRLLFGGAVQRLELPLPGPELQPVYAPGTIIR